ncbi:ATP-dependent helicase [Ruminococcus sp. CLA-AA-H200]|uniref:DNA 3'-5' helicase n=1 Tax=Ruminococcus turbiniformis TaxID=2881258 RepID=A0ABS8FYE2_9FIRM|nr:ATP-dependent helicase [Ruminococcus turbiniformis]MCC2254614.1 ATP-dependent helicase [Ruminococcus turbiniformis]
MQKNEAQEEVINTINGQILVIACPGSGKTTTLLRRINHMVESGIQNILMITFTAAAAGEMRTRYAANYGNQEGITFSTIHALCFAIIRKFKGFARDDLLTPAETWSFFYDLLKNETQINDKQEFISALLNDISVMKNNRIPEGNYKMNCCDDRGLFLKLYWGYESFKKANRKIDYDDMLDIAYSSLDGECLSWLKEQYQYIQVDEYQDTNYIQRDIIYKLAGDNGNLAVVGDDDQSIYAFRGARPEIMLGFQEHYPDCKIVRMGTNYRSCKEIIHAADHLISHNKTRFDKEFRATRTGRGKVVSYITRSRNTQNILVVQKIKELLHAGEKDIAILYRTNRQSEAFAALFVEEKIPFFCTEPIKSRYDHWMYRDIQAYRKIAEGNAKPYIVAQAANHPQRWISKEVLTNGLDLTYMLDRANKLRIDEWKKEKQADQIYEFYFAVREFAKRDPAAAIDYLYNRANYKKYIDDYARYRNEDADTLHEIWRQYTKDLIKAGNDWNKWDQYVRNYEKALKDASSVTDGVVLSTMHKSKGLEWKYVFIVDCVTGFAPFKRAESPDELEEERRLFYVAVTRAKDYLSLFGYKSTGKGQIVPSPYLLEMKQ